MAKPEAACDRGPRELAGHDARLAVRQPAARRAALPVLDGRDRGERGRALGRQPRAPGRLRAGEPASAPSRRSRRGRFDDQIVPVDGHEPQGRAGRRRRATSIRARTRRSRRWRSSGRRSARGRHRHGRQQLGHQRRRLCGARRRGGAGPEPWVSRRWPGSSRRRSPGSIRRSWASDRCRRRARRSNGPGSPSPTSTSSSSTRRSPSQSLVCIDELGLDPARVNVNGGRHRARSSARHERRPARSRCSSTSCGGPAAATAWPRCASASGQGIATVVERIES